MNDERYCGNNDLLVSYLYGELDEPSRAGFDAHLASCAACAGEVEGMRSVRARLAGWEPPETILGFRVVRQPVAAPPPRQRWAWLQLPGWAQLAAASLIIGVATGLSGIEVRYDAGGFVVRTGWSKAPAPATAQAAAESVSTASAPWKPDLVALGQQLREEFQKTALPTTAAPADARVANVAAGAHGAPVMSDQEYLTRVRALIEASEQRQQRELALRLAEVVRDMDTQRRTDLARVASGISVIEGRTGAAVAQQREVLNYLMRVSQRQEPPR